MSTSPLYTPVTVLDSKGVPHYRSLMNIGIAQEISEGPNGGAIVLFERPAGIAVRESVDYLEAILSRTGAVSGPRGQVANAVKVELLAVALEETNSLLAAMLHEQRPQQEIMEQIHGNRTLINSVRGATA